jgi:enamine deaminase RidA (YjgF/YER057c/UK114 family)
MPEYHAMVRMTNAASYDVAEQYNRIEAAVDLLLAQLPDTEAVWMRYFVSDAANQHPFLLRRQDRTAVSVVQQPPLNGAKVALWLYLIPKGHVSKNGQATVMAHSSYRHLFHTQLFDPAADETKQTASLFGQYIDLLKDEGCTLAGHCVRTWVFVQGIDTHYAGMVAARKACFDREGLTKDTHFIASTGIEGKYIRPEVLVFMDAYAVKGLQPEQIRYLHAPTHLNPTHEYGVTFERGTAIQYGDRRHVFISGTASINRCGEIVHRSDVTKQAERMFENILALLNVAGAAPEDVAYMIVYLRDISDCQVIDAWLANAYPRIPKVIVWAPVCRPGWLIEAECMAITPAKDERFAAF